MRRSGGHGASGWWRRRCLVDDLEESEVVVWVGDESEEGGGVEDFLAFEEGVCADEDVGDSAVSEGLFEGS